MFWKEIDRVGDDSSFNARYCKSLVSANFFFEYHFSTPSLLKQFFCCLEILLEMAISPAISSIAPSILH